MDLRNEALDARYAIGDEAFPLSVDKGSMVAVADRLTSVVGEMQDKGVGNCLCALAVALVNYAEEVQSVCDAPGAVAPMLLDLLCAMDAESGLGFSRYVTVCGEWKSPMNS